MTLQPACDCVKSNLSLQRVCPSTHTQNKNKWFPLINFSGKILIFRSFLHFIIYHPKPNGFKFPFFEFKLDKFVCGWFTAIQTMSTIILHRLNWKPSPKIRKRIWFINISYEVLTSDEKRALAWWLGDTGPYQFSVQ